MVHDRRIDGETQVFGNAGALFMNAMTWYDHETETVWSQPWGRGIQGKLKGVELFLLPSQLTTWAEWKAAHPETLAMTNDVSRVRFTQGFDAEFVIGLVLAETAKAYYFEDVAAVTAVNDTIGDYPVVVWAQGSGFHAYLRQVGDQVLTFHAKGKGLVDVETGSSWDVSRGLATAGPLTGRSLQPVPTLSAFDWAFSDFYPDASFYQP